MDMTWTGYHNIIGLRPSLMVYIKIHLDPWHSMIFCTACVPCVLHLLRPSANRVNSPGMVTPLPQFCFQGNGHPMSPRIAWRSSFSCCTLTHLIITCGISLQTTYMTYSKPNDRQQELASRTKPMRISVHPVHTSMSQVKFCLNNHCRNRDRHDKRIQTDTNDSNVNPFIMNTSFCRPN